MKPCHYAESVHAFKPLNSSSSICGDVFCTATTLNATPCVEQFSSEGVQMVHINNVESWHSLRNP